MPHRHARIVRGWHALVVTGLLVSPAPASAQKVKTDFDPAVNFASVKTYYWAKTDPIPGNDLVNQRIVSAVDYWLTSKGWTKVADEQADIAVAAHVATQQSQSVSTFYDGMGYGPWGYGGWGTGMSTTYVDTVTEGTLIVDLFNGQTKKLAWRGKATDTVSDDPKKNAKTIQKALEKMFKSKFPPGAQTD